MAVLVEAACLLGLSQEERDQQLYLALYEAAGGVDLTDPDCFPGLSREEKQNAIYLAAASFSGATPSCFYGSTEQDGLLYEALGGTECFSGLSQEERRLKIYEAVFALTGTGDPDAFLCLSPEGQLQALFTSLLSGCTVIEGETGSTFTPGPEHVGFRTKVCVTWTNSSGSVTSCSEESDIIIAAGPPVAYLVDEGFEGAGMPAGWAFVVAPDWDYASSPIVGFQMLNLNAASEDAYVLFAGQADVWLYFRYRCDTPPANAPFFGFYSAGFAALLAGMHTLSVGGGESSVTFETNGSSSAASATTLTQGANYHVWVHYVSGGACTLHVSSNGTKPLVDGGGAVFISKTGAVNSAAAIYFALGTPSSGVHSIDHVLVSTTEIGDNP